MKNKPILLWDEAGRAFLCMLPMLVAPFVGLSAYIVALGQAGFFYSSLPLPQKRGTRLLIGSILATLGLGFYLMGGNVVFNPWLSIGFTFFLVINIALLSGWEIIGPLALTFITIYSAGLNASSPEKVHTTFFAFLIAMIWATIVSLLPFWKGTPVKPTKLNTTIENLETGIRMGIGTSLALFIDNIFGLAKFGWSVSAVGNVVRFDKSVSKMRAWARLIATIGGVIIVVITFFITMDPIYLMLFGLLFAVLNGLFKATKIGQMPLFYTATILILYSMNDLSGAPILMAQRIAYNTIGIVIGILVVLYPFPIIVNKIKKLAPQKSEAPQV